MNPVPTVEAIQKRNPVPMVGGSELGATQTVLANAIGNGDRHPSGPGSMAATNSSEWRKKQTDRQPSGPGSMAATNSSEWRKKQSDRQPSGPGTMAVANGSESKSNRTHTSSYQAHPQAGKRAAPNIGMDFMPTPHAKQYVLGNEGPIRNVLLGAPPARDESLPQQSHLTAGFIPPAIHKVGTYRGYPINQRIG